MTTQRPTSNPLPDLTHFISSLPATLAGQGEAHCRVALAARLDQIAASPATTVLQHNWPCRERLRRTLAPLVDQSLLGARMRSSTRLFVDDFQVDELLWLGRTRGGPYRRNGHTEIGRILNALLLDMPFARAHQHRVLWLRSVIGQSGPRIAAMGCRSAIEWRSPAPLRRDPIDLLLVEPDPVALACARRRNTPLPHGRVEHRCETVVASLLHAGPAARRSRDLVYAIGLLDRCQTGRDKRLVRRLWSLVAPGGELIVSCMHPANPSRGWLDLGSNASPEYRDEKALLDLACGLEGARDATVVPDPFRVNGFLRIRR